MKSKPRAVSGRKQERTAGGARARAAAPARRPARMVAYASFDDYLRDRLPWQQRLIRTLRRFVAAEAPALQESVKWGNGCWLRGKVPVVYVYAADDHVQFGFFRGAQLDDPLGLLHGAGQYVRHAKVRRPADIDLAGLRALLAQALRTG